MSCDVGCRYGLDPLLLWLWYGVAAAAPVRRLGWEPPYAAVAAIKKRRKEKIMPQLGVPCGLAG